MQRVAMLWSVVFILFRLHLAMSMFATGGLVPVAFGAGELAALLTTCVALTSGKICADAAGLFVPLGYCLPLFLRPQGVEVLQGSGMAYVLLAVLQCAIRCRLAMCCTVGVPVFRQVFTEFPYSAVRHPLAVIECAMVWCFLGHFYSLQNALTAAVAISGFVAVVAIEEMFLVTHAEYRHYCGRVRWRMIPGVW